jgi:zinc transport system substrate-binding protein
MLRFSLYIITVSILMFVFILTLSLLHRPTPKIISSQIKVVTTIYPLADFTKQAGGNPVEVENLTPVGAEPHDYEPSPADLTKIYESKIFIINGNGIDVWAEKIQNDLKTKGITVIDMSEELPGIMKNDPHFWLDPVVVQEEVKIIARALIKVDPAHKNLYAENSAKFTQQLQLIDQEYRQGLSKCPLNTIVVAHEAFNYLAKRYNLEVVNITGLSPDEEPSARKLAEIAVTVRAKKIHYIFFETLVSPKLADTIANETGAQSVVLNPIEGLTAEQVKQGENYISIMRKNLVNLREGLNCL